MDPNQVCEKQAALHGAQSENMENSAREGDLPSAKIYPTLPPCAMSDAHINIKLLHNGAAPIHAQFSQSPLPDIVASDLLTKKTSGQIERKRVNLQSSHHKRMHSQHSGQSQRGSSRQSPHSNQHTTEAFQVHPIDRLKQTRVVYRDHVLSGMQMVKLKT